MAQFAQSDATEEEIDLGEIGKFKRSFLEEAMKLYPCPVEANYVERLENYDRVIKELGDFKISIFFSLSRLHDKLERLQSNIVAREKLMKDFIKYFDAFPERQGRIHYDAIPTLEKRKKIVEEYCKSKGWNQAELTIPQVLEIRKLPEWINA
jgi:hypothetical protein